MGFGPQTSLDTLAGTDQVIRRIGVDQNISLVGAVTGNVYAARLLSLNSRLYRTGIPTSGIAACAVSICPLGANRMDVANWSALQPVGFPGTPINALVSCRLAPVAIKPEGIFAYNESALRWVNRTPAWERYPHARNGVGAFSLGDLLIVPMGDGGATVYDGYRIYPFDPHVPSSTPNEHTTTSMFMSMGTLKHNIAGATAVSDGAYASAKAISAGSSQYFYVGAADKSAEVRDGSLTTTAVLAAGNTVYVGWIRPFVGIHLGLTAVNSTAGTLTVVVSTGAGTWSAAIAHADFTQKPNATTLGQSGGIILKADPVSGSAWIQSSVNSVTAYWMRITGIPGAATIANCQIIPWAPSIDYTNYPLDGLDRAGALPHILLGDVTRQGDPIWHDLVTIPEPDAIGAVVYGNIGGTNLNRYRALVGVGRFAIWRLDVAPDDHAGTLQHPFLNEVGLYEASALVPVPGKLCRVLEVRLLGTEFDPNLPLRLYYTWDYGKPWNRAPGAMTSSPGKFKIKSNQRGYLFRWAVGWKQSADTAIATQPAITGVEADFEALEDVLDSSPERSMQAQPRF